MKQIKVIVTKNNLYCFDFKIIIKNAQLCTKELYIEQPHLLLKIHLNF